MEILVYPVHVFLNNEADASEHCSNPELVISNELV